MLYIKPDYYDDFICTAEKCEDTCCAGWQIVIDSESLKRYRCVKGPFRKQLHKGISWKKKVFHQDKQKRCAFLNEDNLCDLYSALGEDALCQTCHRYPRHIEEFENVREMTLSISCPEVAKYLLNRTEPVKLEYVETEEEETCADFAEMDFDVLLYDLLEQGRNLLISIFQEREESLKNRCERAVHFAAEFEEMVNDGRAFSVYDLFDLYKKKEETFSKKKLRRPMDYSRKVFDQLFKLERLRDDWESMLVEVGAILYLNGEDSYDKMSFDFEFWQKESEIDLSVVLEQIAVYFVMTYFCGSVYDNNYLAKVQSAVLNVYIIYELYKAKWFKNEGVLDQEDIVEIAYRFSRELEHSDKNLIQMEKIAAAALPVTE